MAACPFQSLRWSGVKATFFAIPRSQDVEGSFEHVTSSAPKMAHTKALQVPVDHAWRVLVYRSFWLLKGIAELLEPS